MADNVTDTGKKILLGAHVDPEKAAEFSALAKSMHMDNAKLIRLMIDEKLDEARHVKKIADKVEKKIRQVARS
jgi:hypothetical protein